MPPRGGDPDAPLVLDLERHGRDGWGDDLDLSRTVGWFTAIAPVRLPANDERRSVAVLKEVKERLRAAPDGGLGFGQLRYCNPRTAAALGRLPARRCCSTTSAGGRPTAPATGTRHPRSTRCAVGPDPDLGTPYLLEINAICDETVDGPRAARDAHLRRRRAGPRTPSSTSASTGWRRCASWVSSAAAGRRRAPSRRRTCRSSSCPRRRSTGSPPRRRAAVEDIWPLSPLQEGVYFQARYAEAAVYIVQNVFDFADPVDVDALRTAYSAVMTRNPVLRSAFLGDDLPQPVAAIADRPGVRARGGRPDRRWRRDRPRTRVWPRSPRTTGCAPSTWTRRRWRG